MRKYIAERVGILEIFQIIISLVVLALGLYGFRTDEIWNNRVLEEGVNLCVAINQEIARKDESALYHSECRLRLNIKSFKACGPTIEKYYLTMSNDPFWYEGPQQEEAKNLKSYIINNMRRREGGEIFFLVSISLTILLFLAHIILASCLKVIELRTKWNATLQAIILFLCGFAGVLLATSVNRIDDQYSRLSKKVLTCGMLRFCDRPQEVRPQIPKDTEVIVDHVLEGADACQELRVKQSITILLIMIIVTCCVMILWAMDLTTIYEEETDEQEEALIRQNDLENFLADDQIVVFDKVLEDSEDGDTEPTKQRKSVVVVVE